MVKEIYIRTEDDPAYRSDIIDHSSELEIVISKILMILKTNKGEVLGDPGFGVNLENYLFTFDLDEHSIKKEITDQISTYITESKLYNINIELKRFRGTVRDLILLDIIIDGRKMAGVLIK